MKEAPMVTSEEVKSLRESSGEGLMTCNKILNHKRKLIQKEYANDALFDAINKWNGGFPQEAFMELIEVVSYLVNSD